MSLWQEIGASQTRERQRIVQELIHVKGLMPLLMKPRNGAAWSVEEKAELVRNLRAMSDISPYLVPMVMPGGMLVLPVLAWWLDRRRQFRSSPPS